MAVTEEQFQLLQEDLKVFKEAYEKELVRQSQEREAANVEDSQEAELEAEKDKVTEERLQRIDDFIVSQNSQQEQEATFRADLLTSLDELDQADSSQALNEISNKLTVIIEGLGVSDEQVTQQEVSYFTDLSIITFLFAFIPVYLAYKGLTRLFDSAFA